MQVLNLYAGIGGNRYKWENCKVTAIEIDSSLCEIYKERYPNDLVINTDSIDFLKNNFSKFDIIWSSPPCQTHSRVRFANKKAAIEFPDFRLYEQIVFLKTYFKGRFIIENVIPFYEPLIQPAFKTTRHLFWTNFKVYQNFKIRENPKIGGKNELAELSDFHSFDFYKYMGRQRRTKIARNTICYELGLELFEQAATRMHKPQKQTVLF